MRGHGCSSSTPPKSRLLRRRKKGLHVLPEKNVEGSRVQSSSDRRDELGIPFTRRTISGLDILLPTGKAFPSSGDVVAGSSAVAQRTRSHFCQKSSLGRGTFSEPIVLDETAESSSSSNQGRCLNVDSPCSSLEVGDDTNTYTKKSTISTRPVGVDSKKKKTKA